MGQVDPQLTPSDAQTMAGAMVYGYRQVYGVDPPRNESWIYPLAVSSLETAHWTAMYNWNAGNITTNGSGDWYYNPGVTVDLKFISYRDAGSGARGEISWLKSHGVQQYADDGDLAGFQAAMTSSGYGGGTYPSLSALVSQLSSIQPANYTPPWFVVDKRIVWAGVGVGAGVYAAWIAMELLGTPSWAPRWVKAVT